MAYGDPDATEPLLQQIKSLGGYEWAVLTVLAPHEVSAALQELSEADGEALINLERKLDWWKKGSPDGERPERGQIGFDGHWASPTGFHLVIEAKTSDTYAIKASTLVGYVDELISEKVIPNWQSALGLYVLGREDAESRQIQNAIMAEGRAEQLRLISMDSLLSLAELMSIYDVTHEDVLAVLRPSGPSVDPVVDLMTRLVAQRQADVSQQVSPVSVNGPVLVQDETATPQPPPQVVPLRTTRRAAKPQPRSDMAYWLTPVKSDADGTAEETVRMLVGREHIYAFGDRTPGRKQLKVGDWMCFYANGKGIIAHARVASLPEYRRHPKVRHQDKYPWVFRVDSEVLYLDSPVVVDSALRSRLEGFKGRDPDQYWSFFVQGTHRYPSVTSRALRAREHRRGRANSSL